MGQGVIPDDWTGEYCAYSVCWPDSPQWLAVLRGVLTLPATGRFWDENTGTITEAQAVIRDTFDHNLHLGEVLMSCNDATAAALNNIANAIIQSNQSLALTVLSQGNACCEQTIINQNGGVQGSTPQASDPELEVPIYGTQPPIGVPPGTYPEGYESLEEYQLDKCQIANLIVDGLIGSLRNLGLITFTNIAGLAGLIVVAIVGLIAFPPAAIPMMVALLLTAAGVFSLLDAAADEIEGNREEWVCAMYANDNVENVISVIADLIDTLIAAIPITEPRAAAIKGIILLLLNSDTLNQLFKDTAHVAYPGADCSNCTATWVIYDGGELELVGDHEWIWSPDPGGVECSPVGTVYSMSIERFMEGVAIAGEWTLTLESGTLNNENSGSPNSCNYTWRGGSCEGVTVFEHLAVEPSWPTNLSSITVRSVTPFTMRITIANEGEVSC